MDVHSYITALTITTYVCQETVRGFAIYLFIWMR